MMAPLLSMHEPQIGAPAPKPPERLQPDFVWSFTNGETRLKACINTEEEYSAYDFLGAEDS